nr:hypothetical protein [Rhizobium indicum]
MKDVYQPLYKWRETWPGEGHQDFTGFDGEQSFGRIQLDQASHGKMGMWKWNITHIPWVREHIAPHSGWEAGRHAVGLRSSAAGIAWAAENRSMTLFKSWKVSPADRQIVQRLNRRISALS